MAKVVFEITHSHRFGKEFKSFDTSFIHIGRGYHNDLILNDSHISDKHLLITQDQDGWLVEDLGSENGLYINKETNKISKARITSGDKLTIGRTHLRILSPNHPISKTKILAQTSKFLKALNTPLNITTSLVGMLVIYAYEALYHSPKEVLIQKLILSSFGFLLLAVIWSGIWAFIGRTIKHKAQFFFQLALSCLFLFCLIPLSNISAYLGYFSSNHFLEAFSTIFLIGTLLFWFLSSTLLIATNISKKVRIIVSTSIPLIVFIFIALTYFAFKDDFNTYPYSHSTLKPPLIKLLPSKTIESFIEDSKEVFTFNKKELKLQ